MSIDFKLQLIDHMSKEMKKVEKITTNSLGKMSKDQKDYTKQIFESKQEVLKLQKESLKASKDRQKQIKEEIRLIKQRESVQRQGLSAANKAARSTSKGTSVTGKSGGISGALGSLGIGAGVAAPAAIGAVYLKGAEKFKDTLFDIVDLQQQWAQVTDDTVLGFQELSAKTQTIAKVFNQDSKDIIKGTTTLSKEFGISARDSLKLVEEGFKKGANANGEFLEILKEYPAQLKSVGLDAKESIAFLTLTSKAGVYSDKGVDTIKEAGLRLRENKKAIQDALKPLSNQTKEQIKLAVASGDTWKAIKIISKELKNTKLPAKQVQEIISNVFGGPGEDAGRRYIEMLGDMNLELGDIKESMSTLQKAQLDLESSWNNFVASVSEGGGIITKAITFATDKISGLLNAFAEFNKSSKNLKEQGVKDFDETTKKIIESSKTEAEVFKKIVDERNKLIEKRNKLQEKVQATEDSGIIKALKVGGTALTGPLAPYFGGKMVITAGEVEKLKNDLTQTQAQLNANIELLSKGRSSNAANIKLDLERQQKIGLIDEDTKNKYLKNLGVEGESEFSKILKEKGFGAIKQTESIVGAGGGGSKGGGVGGKSELQRFKEDILTDIGFKEKTILPNLEDDQAMFFNKGMEMIEKMLDELKSVEGVDNKIIMKQVREMAGNLGTQKSLYGESINEMSASRSVKNITLNVQKIVGVESMTTNNIKESSTMIGQLMSKELTKAVLDVNLSSNYG